MKLIISLLCLSLLSGSRGGLVNLAKLAKMEQCGPDETSCPSGCCPEPHWFCCGWPEDDIYCAATADDCPFQDKRTELGRVQWTNSGQRGFLSPWTYAVKIDIVFLPNPSVRVAAIKQCVGTECPGGCCPEVGWYCCPDDIYCAASAADCPFVAKGSSF